MWDTRYEKYPQTVVYLLLFIHFQMSSRLNDGIASWFVVAADTKILKLWMHTQMWGKWLQCANQDENLPRWDSKTFFWKGGVWKSHIKTMNNCLQLYLTTLISIYLWLPNWHRIGTGFSVMQLGTLDRNQSESLTTQEGVQTTGLLTTPSAMGRIVPDHHGLSKQTSMPIEINLCSVPSPDSDPIPSDSNKLPQKVSSANSKANNSHSEATTIGGTTPSPPHAPAVTWQ